MSRRGNSAAERYKRWAATLPATATATCPRCRQVKPLPEFWNARKRKPAKVCGPCLVRARDARTVAKGKVPHRVRVASYEAYLASDAWQAKRLEYWLSGRPHECYVCRAPWRSLTGSGMEMHHRTYDRFGDEELDDLVPVCPKPCHARITRRWAKVRHAKEMTLWELTDQVRAEHTRGDA